MTQTLFNGFKTGNNVRVAEAQVRSGREALRNVGQGTLLDAVTVYMNVLANGALVDAQRANVAFLRQTLSNTRSRLNAGDVTPTDAAQAEARLNRGLADLNATEVALAVSKATYSQVVGEPPAQLVAATPVDRFSPTTLADATNVARQENPAVLAAQFDVDVAQSSIAVAESGLLPTISVQANVSRAVQNDPTLATPRMDQASVLGQVGVPLYDAGMAAAQTRQAKEVTAQSRLVLEQVRNQTRTAVTSAWVTNEGVKVAVTAAESEVRAANVALLGVQREAQAGQRTTVDVPNALQDLTNARARLILAQRDRLLPPSRRGGTPRREDARVGYARLPAGGSLPPSPGCLARPADPSRAMGSPMVQ